MRLLLFGCTGFIGHELIPRLLSAGHQLTLVSRKPRKKIDHQIQMEKLKHIQLDPSDSTSWQSSSLIKALEESEGIINLAGEPIAEKRWTTAHC